MENIASDILRRSRSPGEFLPPDTYNTVKPRMKVIEVLKEMGLMSEDINPVTEADVQRWGIPDECKDFPELYVEAKTHHENQRRRRLVAIIRDVLRVCRNCQIKEWREDHKVPLSQSTFMKVDKPSLLHDLLEKQNKRLRVRKEEQEKSKELQMRIIRKMRMAEERQQSLSQTRCAFKMRLKMRREMTMEKKSMTAQLSQLNLQPTKEEKSIKRPQKLSEIQNIIMRTISRQDFHENTRINEKAKAYKEAKISEKLEANCQRLRKNMMNRLLEHKQSEQTKNIFRIAKAKNENDCQVLTRQHLTQKQSHRNNMSELTPLNQLRIKTRHSQPRNEEALSAENRAANAKSNIETSKVETDKIEQASKIEPVSKIDKQASYDGKKKPKKYTVGAEWLNLDPIALMEDMQEYQLRLLEILNSQNFVGDQDLGVNLEDMERLLSELNTEWEKATTAAFVQ